MGLCISKSSSDSAKRFAEKEIQLREILLQDSIMSGQRGILMPVILNFSEVMSRDEKIVACIPLNLC